MHAIIVLKKFWGLQMLTWVWSTFRPQNFLSGLRVPHEQSFPFPTAGGQLLVCVSPGGSCPPGGSCHPGQPSGGGCRGAAVGRGVVGASLIYIAFAHIVLTLGKLYEPNTLLHYIAHLQLLL